MSVFFKKLDFPSLTCVNELIPVVAKPTVTGLNINTAYEDVGYDLDLTMGTLVHDGNILFMIDRTSPNFFVIFQYDSNNGTFSKLKELTLPNNFPIMIPDLSNGKLYFYGGRSTSTSQPTNQLYVYNFISDSLSLINSGGTARVGGCGCVNNGKLLFFGGTDSSYRYVAGFSEYNIAGNTFASLASGPIARDGGTMVALGGVVYLTGATYIDSSVEAKKFWSWNGTTWNNIATVPEIYQTDAQLTIIDGAVHIVDITGMNASVDPNISRFESGTNTFTPVFGPIIGSDEIQVPSSLNLGKLMSVCQLNGTIYFTGDNQFVINGKVTGESFGTLNLSNNTITATKYQIAKYTATISATSMLVDLPDPEEMVGFEFKENEASTPILVEQAINLGRTIESLWTYELDQPTQFQDDSISYVRIKYKTEHSAWSPWSNWFYRWGGGE